jgi:hypothetical protein
MIPWYYGTILGTLALVIINSIERAYGMNWKMFLIILPILIVCNQGFWFGFYNAPNFMVCWVIGSVLAATMGWISNIFILKESYTIQQIIGNAIAITGLLVMKIK